MTISPESKKLIVNVLIIFAVLAGFVAAFAGGFFLNTYLTPQPLISVTPSITPSQTVWDTGVEQTTTNFLPGKHFYDDGFYVLTQDEPQVAILLTVNRSEQDNATYTQNTRATYIDRKTGTRQNEVITTKSSAIVSDKIINSWVTTIDPSRVLKERSLIKAKINKIDFELDTGPLTNEIGIRSLPGYTKFFSNGTGTLTFNGRSHPAHVLFSHLYSQNVADLQFYTQPLGLTTDLVVFWDQANNLYLIDASQVDNPQANYQTHKIAFFETPQGQVSKTFDLTITHDSLDLPNNLSFNLGKPIANTLQLKRLQSVSKAVNQFSHWYLSLVSGQGNSVPGFGITEFIHD